MHCVHLYYIKAILLVNDFLIYSFYILHLSMITIEHIFLNFNFQEYHRY